MHVDYVEEQGNDDFQSVNLKASKCQIETLGCTLEELAVLKFIVEDNSIKQKEFYP